jgi:hypothetical protein
MLSEMQRAAMIRNEPVDLDGLIRLQGVAQRAVAGMRQLAREVRGEVQALDDDSRSTSAPPSQRRDVGLPETPEARPGLKRDATLPAARGTLRGDRRREAADDQGCPFWMPGTG